MTQDMEINNIDMEINKIDMEINKINFNTLIRKKSRKSFGPHRSTTPLDNFLTPGVLFRFPSDLNHYSDSDSKAMSATFVSACSLNGKSFKNIDLDSEMNQLESIASSLDSISQQTKLKTSLVDSESLIRSISPISVSSTTSTAESESLHSIRHKFLKRKRCDSCGTRKTPYWRDGWELGVTLCNACGIRFHKYRKLCENCRCVAKKDEVGRLHCPKCFDKL